MSKARPGDVYRVFGSPGLGAFQKLIVNNLEVNIRTVPDSGTDPLVVWDNVDEEPIIED